MGAPKQKWTAEEEGALKAGVFKHGMGKWRTILSDPEFSSILRCRSNVDLKDKWRNISVTAIWGSRKKAKLAVKLTPAAPTQDDNSMALTTVPQNNEEIVHAVPLATSGDVNPTPHAIASETTLSAGPKRQIQSLDAIVFEAVTNLEAIRGSDRASIFQYIEEHFKTHSSIKRLITARLKYLVANGKLIKTKHRYKFPSGSTFSGVKKRALELPTEGRPDDAIKSQKREITILTKAQADEDLLKIRGMTAQEAAAAAAQAVAEAEIAIAEAQEAAREAEKAEAEAEAAQAFAKAAMKAVKSKIRHTW